jgi:hypothetical protein
VTTVDLEIECGDEMHRIRVSSDRTLRILDHDESTLRAFGAFGAKPNECLLALQRFEGEADPVIFLLDIVNLPEPVIGKLLCDYAERVVSVYEYFMGSDDQRPRNGIITAFRYWDGNDISKQTLQDASEAANAAREDSYDAEQDLPPGARRADQWRAENASEAAARATETAALHPGLMDVPEEERRSLFAESSGEVLLASRGAVARVDAPGAHAARDEMRDWQLNHALKAIKSWQKGTTWPDVKPMKVTK